MHSKTLCNLRLHQPLKLIVGFLIIVLLALLLGGCGTTWRVEYDSPQYGNAAVQVALPKKEGYAK